MTETIEQDEKERDAWLKAFRAWVNAHEPVDHPVDDSRESVYSGTTDDPR